MTPIPKIVCNPMSLGYYCNNMDVHARLNADPSLHNKKVYLFTGIDHDFVHLVYFPHPIRKHLYLKSVNELFEKLHIVKHTSLKDYLEKMNRLHIGPEGPIDFIKEVGLFKQFLLKEIRHELVLEETGKKVESGMDKIKSYFSALEFVSTNISRKIRYSCYNFSFEEKIAGPILEAISKRYFISLVS
jgi:hypothetical protein